MNDARSPAAMRPAVLRASDGLRYGAMGLPLAFVALPLYVTLPNHYAREFAMPLATLGALLLGVRLLDAVIDPLLGRLIDRLFARSLRGVLTMAALACAVLAVGFAGLFFPPQRDPEPLLAWAAGLLIVTSTAYSLLAIAHQSWGAMLGGDETYRSRVVAWREGLGLAGVVLASLAPVLLGLSATAALFAIALAVGWIAWRGAPRPTIAPAGVAHGPDAAARRTLSSRLTRPLVIPSFRRLLLVFLLNGIASAIPATLVLFFVQDQLQAPASMQALVLAVYFISAAASLPFWMRAVPAYGLARSWLAGMLLAIASFAGATLLGPGDVGWFLLVCAASGIALGTDLALPGALLAGLIGSHGDRGHAEGAYFGWWNFAAKLNLALAAGLSLPLLAWFGYTPGARDTQALQALTLAYCVLPCVLKLLAAGSLQWLVIRPARRLTVAAPPLRSTL